MTTEKTTTLSLASLPALGAPLENGTFAGITTHKDGTHFAVVLLPKQGEKLTWKKALTWAKKQGGELPSRSVASMLFANVKSHFKPSWHWTCEEDDASYAWGCYFTLGYVYYNHKSFEGSAVAVRLIPLIL